MQKKHNDKHLLTDNLGKVHSPEEIEGVVVAKSVKSIRDSEAKSPAYESEENIIDFVIEDKDRAKKTYAHEDNEKVKSLKKLKKENGFSFKKVLKGLSIFAIILTVLGIIGATVLGAVLINYYIKAEDISKETLKPGQSSIVYFADGNTEFFRYGGNENREVVKLSEIPKQMQWAVIALEQKDFYKEDLPLKSLVRAITNCAGKAATTFSVSKCESGASGIAQQLYKNVTGKNDQSLERKIRELFAAQKLIQNNSKDQILELYLNWVSYGPTFNGVQVASKEYFNKPISQISIPQACLLASMPQRPTDFGLGIRARANPDSANYKFWLALQDRKNTCLENLYNYDIQGTGEKLITSQAQLDELKKQDLGFNFSEKTRKYPHWQEYVQTELAKIFPNPEDLNKGGLKIVTTLDPAKQDGVDEIMKRRCQFVNQKFINAGAGVDANAAMVALDAPTGNIVAMVGSCDYYDTARDGNNNAVTSTVGLTPGSTFKPYDYLAAIEKGFNPSTVLLDIKTNFNPKDQAPYEPDNFDKSFRGPVTFAYALQNSLNIPAIKAAVISAGAGNGDPASGMNEVNKIVENLGLKYTDNPDVTNPTHCRTYASTAIGACPVNMLSHAVGFNTLSQDGNLRTARPFLSITVDHKDMDKALVDAENAKIAAQLDNIYPKKDASVNPISVRLLNTMITDNNLRTFSNRTSDGLVIPNWIGKIAGKTGTSTGAENRVKNVWTAGYTKKYTVVVWAGNMKGETLKNNNSLIGGEAVAAPIWNEIMQYLHKDIDPNDASNTFSTEGLVKGNAQCPAGTSGGGRCANEWMSQDGLNLLNKYKAIASNNSFDVNKSNIYEFRNEVLSYDRTVNKLDGKLVRADVSFPSEMLEQKSCSVAPSAFPQNDGWARSGYATDLSCNQFTDIDPSQLAINVTTLPVLENDTAAPDIINVMGQSQIPQINFPHVELRIDGESVAIGANTVNYSAANNLLQGKKNVTILAVDQFGRRVEKTFSNIDFHFSAKEMSETDLESISVVCGSRELQAGQTYSCSFALPQGKVMPNRPVTLVIGNSADSNPCKLQVNTNIVNCSNFKIPKNIPSQKLPILIRIGTSTIPYPTATTHNFAKSNGLLPRIFPYPKSQNVRNP